MIPLIRAEEYRLPIWLTAVRRRNRMGKAMISNLICLNNSRILRKNTAVNFTAVFLPKESCLPRGRYGGSADPPSSFRRGSFARPRRIFAEHRLRCGSRKFIPLRFCARKFPQKFQQNLQALPIEMNFQFTSIAAASAALMPKDSQWGKEDSWAGCMRCPRFRSTSAPRTGSCRRERRQRRRGADSASG